MNDPYLPELWSLDDETSKVPTVPYDEERLEHQYPVWPISEWMSWNDLSAYDALAAWGQHEWDCELKRACQRLGDASGAGTVPVDPGDDKTIPGASSRKE